MVHQKQSGHQADPETGCPQRSQDGPKKGLLGITREIPRHSAQNLSSGQIEVIDPDTGEIVNFSYCDKSNEFRETFDAQKHTFEKWWMLRAAQKLLSGKDDHEFRFKTFDFAEHCMMLGAMPEELTDGKIRRDAMWSEKIVFRPIHQVVTCHKDKLGFDKQPEIWKSEKTGRARFHKVKVCGSVWTCPVCSSAITEARRLEVSNAVAAAVGRDWDVMLVTFTLRHGVGDDLEKLTIGLKAAQEVLQKSYVWKTLIRRKATKKNPVLLDFKGKISALEVKYGANGWHPHQHDLFFFGLKLDAAYVIQLQKMLAVAWIAACEKVGLAAPSLERGVDVRRAMNAQDYVTKFGSERFWTIDRELTKGSSKNGAGGSRTPFKLLFDYASGDHGAGQLFRVFAGAFKGRHQLQFSVTLKKNMKAMGVDLTDSGEEFDVWLASVFGLDSHLLGELTDNQFDIIRQHDLYASVLQWAADLGFDKTMQMIDEHDPCAAKLLKTLSPVVASVSVPPGPVQRPRGGTQKDVDGKPLIDTFPADEWLRGVDLDNWRKKNPDVFW